MIDFIKYELKNTPPESLEQNPLLEFHNNVNLKTGELGRYVYAFYKGLEFRIYDTTMKTSYRRITVEGSLHKFWNSGAHNFNDFGISQLNEVLKELKDDFNILPNNCAIRALEIGININPPYKTKSVLNQCLMHKTNRFKWIYTKDEGSYIQCSHQRHTIKIYDKRTHYQKRGYNIDNEILRFEIKYTKMKYLNDKGIFTLQNLLDYGLDNFRVDLLREWHNVMIFDKIILTKSKYNAQYSNLNFWLSLNYNNFRYHRNNLNKIHKNNPDNIKFQIANLIEKKCAFLNT